VVCFWNGDRDLFVCARMKSENFLVSAVFVTSLTIFAGLGLIGSIDFKQSNSISNQENRNLASFPPLRSLRRDVPKFPALFENFYNDHFLLRLSLSRWRNYLDYAILQSSGNTSVALGRNHWLFYALNKLPVTQQNLDPYEEPELNGALKMFCARRDILAAHGIKYILVFAPEKGTIYPELMPRGWTRRPAPGRLEQLQAALLHKQIDFVDARSVLLEAKRREADKPLYFSNDSHWNRYGAFLVAQQLFRQLHLKMPAVTPFEAGEMKLEIDNHSGDLALLLGLQNLIWDKRSLTATIMQKQAHAIGNQGLPRFESGIVETATEPSAFRVNNVKLPRAFILHDSFMEFLQPYFADKFSFSEFYLARLLLPEVVLGEKPDVVIDEIAERHLYDRGFDNIPTFSSTHGVKQVGPPKSKIASFQSKWQLLCVKTKAFERSLGIELHWQALIDGKLDDRVQVCLLDAKTKEIKGVTDYRQDSFARPVKAGDEWVDVVPVKAGGNDSFDQIGIMVIGKAGALYCDSARCDFKVRAIVDSSFTVAH
jgi:alginate O-acetyltransferase complex protein AlgJ